MKRKAIYCSLLLTISLFASAQDMGIKDPGPGNVTVYSGDGDAFTLFLNGDRKNASPTTRVSVDNVTEVPIEFRIVFENGSLGELKKRGLRQGKFCLYSIEKNKKGEHRLTMKGCSDESPSGSEAAVGNPASNTASSSPAQLSASVSNGQIMINDGRILTLTKVKANGMTYPRVHMTALPGARVTISYDDNGERYSAESPFQYEVKDFSNNNAYLTLTVDEGGPEKTWHVKLQNSNGYDLNIE